jgi:hypothetical protein
MRKSIYNNPIPIGTSQNPPPRYYYLISVCEEKTNIFKLINSIYKKEGIPGFFRGYMFSIFAGSLSNALFFWK